MKDVNLSKRMETVVSMVSPQSFTIADVGCDHAYVSIALINRKLAEKVVAMDVRQGPLDIAKRNVTEAGYLNEIDIRLGDGLVQLQPGEADTIIIAGMGGLLIEGILERGLHILFCETKRPTLILQPQSDLAQVRKFLYRHAYHIVQEKMLIEDGKYYTVMKAEPINLDENSLSGAECNLQDGDEQSGSLVKNDTSENNKSENRRIRYNNDASDVKDRYSEAEWEYGRYNLENKCEVLLGYLRKEHDVLEQIHKQIQHSVSKCIGGEAMVPESTRLRLESIKNEIIRNEQALHYYE